MNFKKIRKYIKDIINVLEDKRTGFNTGFDDEDFTTEALDTARHIRGDERGPSIIIQGVMPRSGTVYVGELFKLHPDIHAYPNNMWEVPFLEITGDIIKAQENFFDAYKQNKEYFGKYDFLPLFGSAMIRYLFSFTPENKRVLLKIPDVQYLNFFYKIYPKENILLLMRDGRDLVSSTIRSWPGTDFKEVCQLWNDCAKIMLKFRDEHVNNRPGIMFSKYENILKDPATFVADSCKAYNLDSSRYPYDQIDNIAVRGSSIIRKQGDKNVTWDAVSKPKDFKTTGHWNNWTRKEKKIFKNIAGKTLADAGYAENFNW